jgi:hypothetical protein
MEGARDIADALIAQAACEGQEIFLAGYSQGAVAVRQALRLVAMERPEVLDRISGIALFGDAILWAPPVPAELTGRTLSLCELGDPVCSFAPQSWVACETRATSCPHFQYAVEPEEGLSGVGQAALFFGLGPVPIGELPGTAPTAPTS